MWQRRQGLIDWPSPAFCAHNKSRAQIRNEENEINGVVQNARQGCQGAKGDVGMTCLWGSLTFSSATPSPARVLALGPTCSQLMNP